MRHVGKQSPSRNGPHDDGDRTEPVVRLVDDDALHLRAVALVLRAAGFHVEPFDGVKAFLAVESIRPGCAVLDLHMPGGGGLELQEALAQARDPLPVIILTGQGNVPTSVRAMKNSAIDFSPSPWSQRAHRTRIRRAVAVDQTKRAGRRQLRELRGRV